MDKLVLPHKNWLTGYIEHQHAGVAVIVMVAVVTYTIKQSNIFYYFLQPSCVVKRFKFLLCQGDLFFHFFTSFEINEA